MKITVSELMELKKEIFNSVRQAQNEVTQTSPVEIFQNGKLTGSTCSFDEKFLHLKKVLNNSQVINSAIASFNALNNVDVLVRERNNMKALKLVLEQTLQKAKATTSNGFMNVGNERIAVETITVVAINLVSLKKELKLLTKEISTIQNKIFMLNMQEIEVPLEEI